jgi:predicted nucleic acid-binding protein
MIVVADTGPFNYLVLIEAVAVLQPLYRHVVVPTTVAEELRSAGAPAAVQAWIAKPPDWLEVRPDPPPDPALRFLDPGESAALSLAELLGADQILIDDRDGRTEAERRHLHVTGTVGVLADGHLAGLLDFDQSLVRLRATNFRLSGEVERLVRRRLAEQKKEP